MSIKNFIKLAGVRFVVSYRNFIEFIKVSWRYYRDFRFFRLDTYLLRSYLINSPYRIANEFLKERGETELYTYGETPLTTVEHIAKECQIKADDTVYELGSGRGRACFWLHHFIGCKVVGVEYVPEFVRIAHRVKHKFALKGVYFRCKDILEENYRDATMIYFYGTCSDTAFILKLIDKLAQVSKNTKIITVSYPLTAYTTKPLFELVKVFPARFTWGTTDIYLHIRK